MTAKPVVHYQRRLMDWRATCGRDVLGLSHTTDPHKVTCRLCAEHEDVQRARAQGSSKGVRDELARRA